MINVFLFEKLHELDNLDKMKPTVNQTGKGCKNTREKSVQSFMFVKGLDFVSWMELHSQHKGLLNNYEDY